MQVLLLEDVVGLGDIGETVKVKPGYARNFLIPKSLAVEAGAAAAKVVQHKMIHVAAKKRRMKTGAEQEAEKIRELALEFDLRVSPSGKAFGSISSRDIAAMLEKQGMVIDRRRVLLSEAIRKIGTHFVDIKLHPEVRAQLKVIVNKREATEQEKQKEAEEAKARVEQKTATPDAAEQEEASVEASSIPAS